MNHKLIYEATPVYEELWAARRKVREAQAEADAIEKALMLKIAKLCGRNVDELTQADHGCLARGVDRHVYVPREAKTHPATGVGHYVCIFCGLDDFDL